MRLIDADELMEHVWRDKLDSRELIAKMVDNAPTVKEIPTEIPINIFEQLISQQPKTGKWIVHPKGIYAHLVCNKCLSNAPYDCRTNFCPNCGAKMEVNE